MFGRMLKSAALLAVCGCALSARPASAECARFILPPSCSQMNANDVSGSFQFPASQTFSNSESPLSIAALFVQDLGDVRTLDNLSIWQSEFIRECLYQDICDIIRAPLSERCEMIARLRSRLLQLRWDGRLNNCYFRLRCGFNPDGTLRYCPEGFRRAFTDVIVCLLDVSACLLRCNGLAPA